VRTTEYGFVGRRPEIARLHQAWQEARAGAIRVAGIEGDAGIGKTALVRRFLDEAGPATVVWISGDEAEATLPWGVLTQVAAAMPGSRTALGLDGPVTVVSAGEALARDLRGRGEVVLVVDDAHWADPLSTTALRVAMRRLAADAVLAIVVYQPAGGVDDAVEPQPAAGLDAGWRRIFDSDRGVRLSVAGLPATDLVRLAVACGHPGLSPAGAARLHEHTGGHPLYVRHLLDELPMHSIAFGHGALPAPRGLAAAIAPRLRQCQPRTRELVAAGAVLGRRFSLAGVRVLMDGAALAGAVAEAVAAGLLAEIPGSAGQELVFTSTLVRGLVYHKLDRTSRRELHRRATLVAGTGAVWHRIAAADGPDPELAEDIEREARQYLARGQIPLAATYLRHALDLTRPGPERGPRLLAAVETLLVAGDVASTLSYQGEVAAGTGAWFDYVAGYQLLLVGQVTEATERLDRGLATIRAEPTVSGGERADGEPVDLEARIATQLAIIAVLTVSYPEMIEHGAAAVATAREPWVAAFAWFARALGLAVAGHGAQALAELSGVDGPGRPGGLDGLVARGMIRLWTDDLDGARLDLTRAVHRATQGEALRIGQALGFLGEVEYRRGALAEAVLHTELAVGDAEENNRVWDYAMLHALATYPLAAQARWDQARAHAEQAAGAARLVATPAASAYAAASRAAIAQARGDAAGLLAAAQELESSYPTPEPGTHLLAALRADALSQLGRVVEARAALAEFAARAGATGRQSAEMSMARVRGQIAAARGRYADALAECRQALRLAREVGLPLEAARIDLLIGGYCAAAGQRAAAERQLRSALRQFTALGAEAYAAQVLLAADRAGISMDAAPDGLGVLTPAERAVANLVCRGLSNRQVADRLVLSQKTVEFHLTNAFRRLDISTRAELSRIGDAQGVAAQSVAAQGVPAAEPGWSPGFAGDAPGSPVAGEHLR
jgi:DNA-binding CsgD family transcriptional regulator